MSPIVLILAGLLLLRDALEKYYVLNDWKEIDYDRIRGRTDT